MQASYNKLWKPLVDLDISTADLRKATSLASGTMTKLRRAEDASLDVLKEICSSCNYGIEDVVEFIPVKIAARRKHHEFCLAQTSNV